MGENIWDAVACRIESPGWLVGCLVDVPENREKECLNLDGMSDVL